MLDRGVDRIPVSRPGVFSRFVTAVIRLIFPVVALVASLALAFSLRDEPVPELAFLADIDPLLDTSDWMNWGYIVLPLVFFVLNLTSRRYGAALALTASLLAWLLIGGGIVWLLHAGLIEDFEASFAPYALAGSFLGAIAFAQLVNILLFDWLRGIPWWKAPFLAALFGGLAFSVVFNTRPAHVWDMELGGRLAVEAALHLSWALAQLLPTYLLRSAVRPLPGFGGA
ncbi:MAG: VUT family protein [Parvibaculaceae bacterium]|nr:VUT family protein [Parvibaculaceae bacterium]